MPINSKHPEYAKNELIWTKTNAAYEGEEKIKELGQLYLPAVGGMDTGQYDSYVMRASYFGATGRTVDGLVGAIFRKDPSTEIPQGWVNDFQVIGDNGESISLTSKQLAEHVMIAGRVGVLVDAGTEEGAKPYVTIHPALSVINWQTEMIDDQERLTMVVIKQKNPKVDPKDPYKVEMVDQWLELFLDNGVYTQRLWEEKGGTSGAFQQVGEDRVPRMTGGKTLDQIPFMFVTPKGLSAGIEKSPILDLANVNISHYRSSADYEHGLHFTALPTAYTCGFGSEGDLTIGASVAWQTDNENAKAGFLEFTGSGLGSIKEAMEQKEKQMAVLGSKLLEDQTGGQEAFKTVELRQSGENSVLSSISRAISEAITIQLNVMAAWQGKLGKNIKVVLNTDFSAFKLEPQEITALLAAVQSGKMSFDTYFYNMQRGEMYKEGHTLEEEKDLIEAQV